MEESKVHIHPRRLARKMAKADLDKHGATGYNKPHILPNGKIAPSTFAQHWKKFAIEAANQGGKKGRK